MFLLIGFLVGERQLGLFGIGQSGLSLQQLRLERRLLGDVFASDALHLFVEQDSFMRSRSELSICSML